MLLQRFYGMVKPFVRRGWDNKTSGEGYLEIMNKVRDEGLRFILQYRKSEDMLNMLIQKIHDSWIRFGITGYTLPKKWICYAGCDSAIRVFDKKTYGTRKQFGFDENMGRYAVL